MVASSSIHLSLPSLSTTNDRIAPTVSVSIPASPSTFEHEREDVIIRSTTNHRTTILSIPSSAPIMPDLITPTLTPATTTVRRSSTSSIVFSRRRANNNNKTERSNAQLPVVPTLPTKKMKMKMKKTNINH
mmetsp:Transcript_35156/g.35677  ORF Transcript_35156/g.35677 Transcript_35156/m.35677 type:complete len:131 (+) Transcript_35156:194-586(+)